MGSMDSLLNEDIIIDEAAFNTAVNEFLELSGKLQSLKSEIDDMLNDLKAGFDTPAGRKFLSACDTNLKKPLDDQKLVIQHVSDTLKEVRSAYQPVFQEYESLQSAIKQVNT